MRAWPRMTSYDEASRRRPPRKVAKEQGRRLKKLRQFGVATATVSSLALLFLGPPACSSGGDGVVEGQGGAPSGDACEVPTNFTWTSSDVLITPKSDADHDIVSIKDPTIVRYEDRWHVVATTASTSGQWSLAYLNFEDWEDADDAELYYMDRTPGFEGYMAAPHVFFFEPQQKWYLVYQTQPPAYSTTDDISDPGSWTEPEPFFVGKPRSAPELWIDYWVICDDSDCYLFFTGDNGGLYRSKTSKQDFPQEMDEPVLAMRMAENDLFEGSATYKIKGVDQYLTLVEAIGPEGIRYYKAWVADELDGAWTPVQNSFDRPFAGETNVTFEGDAWTRDISHGELIRDGFDEQMVVDLCSGNLRFFYQGQDPVAAQAISDYSQLPYRLALLTQGPSDPDIEPLGLPPTPAQPFPTAPSGDNLLSNPDFENGTSGWMGWGADLGTTSDPVHGGASAGLASERTQSWHGAAQDIFSKTEPGKTYLTSVWVQAIDPEASTGQGGAGGASDGPMQTVSWTVKSSCGDEDGYSAVASAEVQLGEWVELSGTLDVPTCVDLDELVLYAEGADAGIDLVIDDAWLSE